jgi:mycothiol system anti-sigma-R factor
MGDGNCDEMLKEIEPYIDGELVTSLRIELEEHLHGCPPCMERAEFRRHLKVTISTKCSGDQIPAELREKLARLIDDASAV